MRARRDMYGWLRDLYLGQVPVSFAKMVSRGDLPSLPSEDLVGGGGFEELLDVLSGYRGWSPGDIIKSIRGEYVALFVGPLEVAAYPYESWYRDECLMGPSLVRVRGFMQRAGASLMGEGESGEPEDHVSCEFDLMRFLCDGFLGAESVEDRGRCVALQLEFLENHLLEWVPSFCEDVLGAEHLCFYKPISLITCEYIRGDGQMMRDLLVDSSDAGFRGSSYYGETDG